LYKDKPEKAMQVLNEIAVADAEGNAGLKANNLLAIFAIRESRDSSAKSKKPLFRCALADNI
jgi:hypothetical protein